jgi:uncharacterized protein (TIGR02145 family)
MRSKLNKIALAAGLILVVAFTPVAFAQQKGTFKDARDGKTYKTVKIGTQTWMAENLNYNASGSKCYENENWHCDIYGRLYDWNAVIRACPYGWHLPSVEEWIILVKFAGGAETAGTKLKEKSKGKTGSGLYATKLSTDDYGFSALLGGYGSSDGNFRGSGISGHWWSTGESYQQCSMTYDEEGVSISSIYPPGKDYLRSVRCVKD